VELHRVPVADVCAEEAPPELLPVPAPVAELAPAPSSRQPAVPTVRGSPRAPRSGTRGSSPRTRRSRDREELCVALDEQLRVELLRSKLRFGNAERFLEPYVGEKPTVAVALLGADLQPHALAGESLLGEGGGLRAVRLVLVVDSGVSTR